MSIGWRVMRVAMFVALCSVGAISQMAPVDWSLKLKASPVRPGSSFEGTIVAKIDPGWHIYSLTQAAGGPAPTKISVPDNPSFKLKGNVAAPKPISKFDDAFGMETEYYESNTTFSLPLAVQETAQPGKTELNVNIRFMVCNAQQCLPPKTIPLHADVEIKPKGGR